MFGEIVANFFGVVQVDATRFHDVQVLGNDRVQPEAEREKENAWLQSDIADGIHQKLAGLREFPDYRIEPEIE